MNAGFKVLSTLIVAASMLGLQVRQTAVAAPTKPASAARSLDIAGIPPAFTGGPPPGPRPHPLPPSPSMAVVRKIIRAAVAACHGKHIGVAVLDSAGYPKLVYVPDGTQDFQGFLAFRKAFTALAIRKPSGDAPEALKTDASFAAEYGAHPHNYITFAGGLLIYRGKHLLGAVAVSGAGPSDIDQGCARAAIKAVAPLLAAK